MRVFASNWTLGLWIAISGIGASSAQAGTRAETTAGVGTVTKVVTDLTVYIDELDRAATALERAGTAEATELAKTLRHDCTPVERSLLSDADRFHLSITLPSPAFTDGEMTGRGAGELLQFHCGGLRTFDASNLAVVFRIERDADGALVAYDSRWIRTSRDLDGTAPGALVRRAETSVVRRIGIVAVSIVAGAVLAKETARWIYPGQNDKQKHAIAGELAGFLGTGGRSRNLSWANGAIGAARNSNGYGRRGSEGVLRFKDRGRCRSTGRVGDDGRRWRRDTGRF